MTLSYKRFSPKIGEAEIHLGNLKLHRVTGTFSKNLHLSTPCFANEKRQIFLCFFSWETLNIFYMIIAVGMSNFHLKTRQLCSYNILNIKVICLKRDWRLFGNIFMI